MTLRLGHGPGAQGDLDRALEEYAGDEGNGTMSAALSARIVDLAQSGFPAIQTGATVSTSILKLIAVGDATGIVLPDEVLARMGVRCGDSLLLTETAEGFGLTARHGDVQNQIGLADDLMRENHAVLRRLSQ